MALEEKHNATDKVDVPGFEGRYAVSPCGKVWSYHTKKWMSPYKNNRGYLSVGIDGKTVNVHRLIAECFCEKGEGKDQVNHIDGNKSNNSASNLEWVTCSENHRHAFDSKLRVNSEKQRAAAKDQGIKNRQFSWDDVIKIRSMYTDGATQKSIADKFNTTQATINNIVLYKTYKEAA